MRQDGKVKVCVGTNYLLRVQGSFIIIVITVNQSGPEPDSPNLTVKIMRTENLVSTSQPPWCTNGQ